MARRPQPEHPHRTSWEFDWRNPNMKVIRRPWIEVAIGHFEQRNEVMTAETSQRFSQQAMNEPGLPSWDVDPSYQWGKKARVARKRRMKQHKAAVEAARQGEKT